METKNEKMKGLLADPDTDLLGPQHLGDDSKTNQDDESLLKRNRDVEVPFEQKGLRLLFFPLLFSRGAATEGKKCSSCCGGQRSPKSPKMMSGRSPRAWCPSTIIISSPRSAMWMNFCETSVSLSLSLSLSLSQSM